MDKISFSYYKMFSILFHPKYEYSIFVP